MKLQKQIRKDLHFENIFSAGALTQGGWPYRLDISILKVPVTLQDDGSWKIEGDDIPPWAMGGPYDTYRVDDLEGTFTDTTCEFSLGFYNTKKQANYPTSYSGVIQ